MTSSRFCQLAIGNWQSAIERRVDIVAAESGIPARRQDLENAVVQLQNRDVESAAAQIENRDLRFRLQLVEPVGERRGGRLVDDPLDGETGGFARCFGGVALRIVEVGRDGDDGARDRPLERRFGIAFQFSQNERRDFLRRKSVARAPECGAAARLA